MGQQPQQTKLKIGPVNERELDEIKDAVARVCDSWDALRQEIAYKYLYALGLRIDGIDWRIRQKSPRL